MMRTMLAVLYTGLWLCANPAAAQDVTGLLTGEMSKLTLADPGAEALPQVELLTMEDAPASLGDYQGKWVVLNFWATWCAPCRHEMPALDRLQAAMPEIAVLPVATGRNPTEAVTRFWEEAAIENLTVLRDPKSTLARQLGVAALPVTLILDPEGREVGRLIGDAEWDSPEAQALLKALQAGS
ncbi:TlpA disulfide reductase family protein [Xinfangfangia sp. CPCC 101601]|uniref:TlpA disulfide reductase family protein n=1 Tax=Pseudogemmobacter lacusdianii TaxID=3069608 RepID=A0ABU0VX81_9RHOB|nr:TlpA disulfide reductase family protein [Xinfangfangia sp. CPCC 101601]MDQ2066356.1 TlpA disulfide reductase family protein [Xinfangfangia sp. CPCC 101601]